MSYLSWQLKKPTRRATQHQREAQSGHTLFQHPTKITIQPNIIYISSPPPFCMNLARRIVRILSPQYQSTDYWQLERRAVFCPPFDFGKYFNTWWCSWVSLLTRVDRCRRHSCVWWAPMEWQRSTRPTVQTSQALWGYNRGSRQRARSGRARRGFIVSISMKF